MEALPTLVKDVDVLLALAPEELAPILLRIVRSRLQNGMFHPDSIVYGPSYPSHRLKEVEVALSEAWQWLRINMLIVPASGTNGQNGWIVLSRRGAALTNEQEFQRFREAAAFPKSLLHSSIADKVWLALARGDLDDAVFAAV